MERTYRLADEPEPTRLERFVVEPFWPLLALMLGGGWLAWPWFVFNGFALGSPTRRKEAWIAGGAFAGSVLYALAVVGMVAGELISFQVARYLIIVMVVVKLAGAYWIHSLQGRTFPLFEHFGGVVRSGRVVVGVGFLIRVFIIAELPSLWRLVLT
ncbi:MAG: hypothetical protein VYE22_23975 [Myxococcota bacterium]|nr:hypothetical protein [Myxococcota bacterium]